MPDLNDPGPTSDQPDHIDSTEPIVGDDLVVLSDLAETTGVSVAELGSILDALLADSEPPVDAGPLDTEALWQRVAELTWGDETS